MILSIIFGFIFGIFVGSFVFPSLGILLSATILSVLVFVSAFFVRFVERRKLFFATFFILGFSLGILRMHFSDNYRLSTLLQFENKSANFVGIVVDEPSVREKSTMLSVLLQKSDIGTTTVPLSERVVISTSLYPRFSYGDQISFFAKLKIPEEINSNDREFDYGGYLRVRGVWYTGGFVHPKLLSENHGSPVKKYLFKIKKSFVDAIGRAIPPPESDLASGLLLGAKQSLGSGLLAEFSRAGVSHIVVLSGYNITIVAESLIAFFAFLPATFSFLVGCVGIILFTILAGGGASAMRAAIMVLVALVAKKLGRQYSVARAFGLAVVVMLVWNPLFLVFDPSFQLSVLATIGIVFVSPILEPYFGKISEKFGLREIISATISTQLVVLPLLIYQTGILSLVALPENILILATVPMAMFLCFLTGFFGLFSLWLSYLPAIFAYALLWYQLFVVHIGATMPLGAVNLPAFSIWVVLIVYIIICVGLLYLQKKKPKRLE